MDKKRRLWRTFGKNKAAFIGLVMSVIIVIAAFLAPWISPYDPIEQDIYHRLTQPEHLHLLGTDQYGRDVLSRVIWATRISLAIGVLSIALGMVIGIAMGLTAGHLGGIIESLTMRLVDVILSFPTLITGLMVVAILGSGLTNIIITIGIVFAPRFARLVYGPILKVKEMEYVNAARVIGASNIRIMIHHLLPNVFGEVLVAGTLWVGTAIIIETTLSFLGLGIAPPTPTWGNMIKSGMDQLTNAPWMSIFPGLAILIAVFSFNMLGDGLRDITDPKLRT